jgi:ferredoxin-thioredoxin reductase catalytic subunit
LRKCGCRLWETKNGDTEEIVCPIHSQREILCPVGGLDRCKYLHIESQEECWCEHPGVDDMWEDGCPLNEETWGDEP